MLAFADLSQPVQAPVVVDGCDDVFKTPICSAYLRRGFHTQDELLTNTYLATDPSMLVRSAVCYAECVRTHTSMLVYSAVRQARCKRTDPSN